MSTEPLDDDTFTVRILWATDGMLAPIISISLPKDMCKQERATMLDAIGDTARERKGSHKVDVFTACGVEDHVSITKGPMHISAMSVRKNGTPRPPPLIKWLLKELPRTGFLPPASRLRFEVSWLAPRSKYPGEPRTCSAHGDFEPCQECKRIRDRREP